MINGMRIPFGSSKAEFRRIGLLPEKPVGREKLFINPKLMQLLTREPNEFAPY